MATASPLDPVHPAVAAAARAPLGQEDGGRDRGMSASDRLACDLAVNIPLRTDGEWAVAWAWADDIRAERGEGRLAPEAEAVILVTKQERAVENGPWAVKRDGSRRRPDWCASGSTMFPGQVVDVGASVVDEDGETRVKPGPQVYQLEPQCAPVRRLPWPLNHVSTWLATLEPQDAPVRHLPGCGTLARGCVSGCAGYDPRFDG